MSNHRINRYRTTSKDQSFIKIQKIIAQIIFFIVLKSQGFTAGLSKFYHHMATVGLICTGVHSPLPESFIYFT